MSVAGCNRAVPNTSSPSATGGFLVNQSVAGSAMVNQQKHRASMWKPLEEKAPYKKTRPPHVLFPCSLGSSRVQRSMDLVHPRRFLQLLHLLPQYSQGVHRARQAALDLAPRALSDSTHGYVRD